MLCSADKLFTAKPKWSVCGVCETLTSSRRLCAASRLWLCGPFAVCETRQALSPALQLCDLPVQMRAAIDHKICVPFWLRRLNGRWRLTSHYLASLTSHHLFFFFGHSFVLLLTSSEWEQHFWIQLATSRLIKFACEIGNCPFYVLRLHICSAQVLKWQLEAFPPSLFSIKQRRKQLEWLKKRRISKWERLVSCTEFLKQITFSQ